MKIRNDFVTNSSSSSYIIAYKKIPDIDESTLIKYPFLKGYNDFIMNILLTEGRCDTTAGTIFDSIEDFEKYFIEQYSWSKANTLSEILEDDEYLAEKYKKVIEYINKGYSVLCKDIDYNDECLIGIIQTLAENNDNLAILRED